MYVSNLLEVFDFFFFSGSFTNLMLLSYSAVFKGVNHKKKSRDTLHIFFLLGASITHNAALQSEVTLHIYMVLCFK